MAITPEVADAPAHGSTPYFISPEDGFFRPLESYGVDRAAAPVIAESGSCFRMTGVMNVPNSGNQGRVDALNITDTVDGALMTVEGHTILIQGVSAADLGVDDFTFL